MRRALREDFFRGARVSSAPTAKGRVELDPAHAYFGLHCLKDKPLLAFAAVQAARTDAAFSDAYRSVADEEHPSVRQKRVTVGWLTSARAASSAIVMRVAIS